MKNNLKEESEKTFARNTRDGIYEVLQNLISSAIKVPVVGLDKIPKNEFTTRIEQLANDLESEMTMIYTLTAVLRYQGKPKSLIFITESGKAIDLLDVKKLDQNNVFDQILDNLKGD